MAAHLLTPALSSGGDVLFANIAREIALLHPEWSIGVLAPDYACDGLAPFFRTVVALPPTPGPAAARPYAVARTWLRRIGATAAALEQLQPALVHTTGDFFVNVLAAARAKRRSNCRWTGVVHHINPPPFKRRNDPLVAAASFALQRVSLRAMRTACDGVSLLNRATRDALTRRGFESGRLHVVGAGIDTVEFALEPVPEPGRRVLWVHRLEPTKGIRDLPKLARLLGAGSHIDVVGGGPPLWRAKLRRDLAVTGMEARVTVHGYVTPIALRALYSRANAFVSCSYEEGWGISLCEALSVGVPCVAYALPVYREIFGDLVATVPVGDVAALARRLDAVLTQGDASAARARRSSGVARYSFAAAGSRQAGIFADELAR